MLYVMNTSIVPSPFGGTVRVREIDADEARDLLTKEEIKSAVGHSATAEALTKLLGIEIPTNRIQIKIKGGDRILAFQLARRLEEGRVIETPAELEEIGYSLRLLDFFEADLLALVHEAEEAISTAEFQNHANYFEFIKKLYILKINSVKKSRIIDFLKYYGMLSNE